MIFFFLCDILKSLTCETELSPNPSPALQVCLAMKVVSQTEQTESPVGGGGVSSLFQ